MRVPSGIALKAAALHNSTGGTRQQHKNCTAYNSPTLEAIKGSALVKTYELGQHVCCISHSTVSRTMQIITQLVSLRAPLTLL